MLKKGAEDLPRCLRLMFHTMFMKYNETQNYGIYLRKLTTEEIERLLSSVLHEMRRRDSDRVTGDVLARSQAIRKMRTADERR